MLAGKVFLTFQPLSATLVKIRFLAIFPQDCYEIGIGVKQKPKVVKDDKIFSWPIVLYSSRVALPLQGHNLIACARGKYTGFFLLLLLNICSPFLCHNINECRKNVWKFPVLKIYIPSHLSSKAQSICESFVWWTGIRTSESKELLSELTNINCGW